MSYQITWKSLDTLDGFDRILKRSKEKPVMIFKHRPASAESMEALQRLEKEWVIHSDALDTYLLDIMKNKQVSEAIADDSGVISEYPQVLLYADGVTMYDESKEMIQMKKIKLALKIINRTFRWMETRA